ncbi:MAG TPA: response regulator transcription factor [Bryobacteraceae bacterium]|jgi:two-component system alkaline phosphatase synthesis response regulator PhoP|nr:response regulator transcription factor [Bryobacteraceae bacterium]HXJ38984.1 response regulator transcription factor [Bryobacteraceae bacterium]
MATILIVEDEPDMATGLRDNLEFEGYEVRIARDGEEALASAAEWAPDLILLDLMLPRRNGLDVCRELRHRGMRIPIIMLTARGQETDKVVGLEIGADDYVTKPFSVRELMARVHVQLRRTACENAAVEQFQFGEVELDFKRQHAARAGQRLHLTAREFDILKYFVRRRGETISRDELLDKVWGFRAYPLSRTVDNHIAKLRQKIERLPTEPEYLITVHGLGYKFLG